MVTRRPVREHGGRRRTGTAVRLAALHAVVLTVVLGVVIVTVVHQFSAGNEALAAQALADESQAYASAIAHAGTGHPLADATIRYLQTRSLPAGTVLVVAVSGQGVLATPGATAVRADPRVVAWLHLPPERSLVETVAIGGSPAELLVSPIRYDRRTVGTLIGATDLAALDAERSRVLALTIAEAAFALLAGVASSYLLLRRLLRKIGRITTTAADIAGGETDRRIGDQGTDDEVSRLAATFDGMLDRLDTSMTQQRRLLSDVSHQLRTPLTIARGHLDVLRRTGGLDDRHSTEETIALVMEEIDRMRTLVERLLLLGRALEPDFLSLEPIDLRSFAADLHDAAEVLAPRRWNLQAVPDLVVHADQSKLRGAMLNLVDNAVRATSTGDEVALVTARRADGSLELAVEDSGGGIPAAQRQAVLQRFARPGARDADGTGLGLAIVKAVAEAHGGTVEVGDSPLGGARLAIVLPATLVTVNGNH